MKDREVKENKTESDKIWEEVKDYKVEMFGFPQRLGDQLVPMIIEPSALYGRLKTSAMLVGLETALAGKFTVERTDYQDVVSIKRVVVRNIPKSK